MSITVSCLCRGEYKNYFLLTLPGVSENVPVSFMVRATEGGQRMPAFVAPFLSDGALSYVLVVPDAPNTGVEFVAECSTAGEAFSLSAKLSYAQIKWYSRVCCRKQRNLCGQIREVADSACANLLSIDYIDCILDGDRDQELVRSAITSRWMDDDISIRWLTADGREWNTETLPMGINMKKSPRETEIAGSEALFSSRMARTMEPLVVLLSSRHCPEYELFDVLTPEKHGNLLGNMFSNIKNATDDTSYPEWLRAHQADEIVLRRQRAVVFAKMPVFSIVVPLYKTPLPLFKEMADSVLRQSYSKWELILVNSTPEVQELADLVTSYAEKESRIRVVTLPENLGIAENTNAGMAVCTGDFVCFFDHDDLLEPDTLYEYARAINVHPDTDVLYCDEDKLLEDGSYAFPSFKSDFNIDLLRTSNYICHMMTIRTSLLRTLNPFSKEYDGAQDHDMVLQAVEKARYVCHVPRILYHWRATAGSTAADPSNKSYATLAGIRAVSAHLERLGIPAEVTQAASSFTYHVRYALPEGGPLVSIIIPSKNHGDILKTCIDSIQAKSTYAHYEIVVVDNGSSEQGTLDYYMELQGEWGERFSLVSYPEPFNFSAMMNLGAATAHGDYLVLLHDDTEVITPDWIEEMLGTCARTDVGAVSALLFYQDDTIQYAGGFIAEGKAWHSFMNLPRGYWGYFGQARQKQDVSVATAACMMTKRSVFDAVAGFNEELAVEHQDTDYCLKLREQGYLIVYTPYAELTHCEPLSRGAANNFNQQVRSRKEAAYLGMRWAKEFAAGDPYLNPNFSQSVRKLMYRSL